MMNLALNSEFDNYGLVRLPDVNSDDVWYNNLVKLNKPFSEILSNNPYDLKIYEANIFRPGMEGQERGKKYDILFPEDILAKEDMLYIDGVVQNGSFIPTKQPFSAILVEAF